MSALKRYCLALDLKNDPALIAQYRDYHQPTHVWPEINDSIKHAGIERMEIYLTGNRLFMIMDVNASFDFYAKALADSNNAKVQEWEQLMWTFQLPLQWAKPGEKWVITELIYQLPPSNNINSNVK
jgi:L-rhamnose mutarotase|tara:strand:+ start:3516 stop:3893 length:378 start_codon:yes stop_codon:yes gene_type:complete